MSDKRHNFKPDTQTLSQLLSAKPLQRLIRGTQNQQILQKLMSEVVPAHIGDNITSCQIENSLLVIGVNNASFATLLRTYRQDLLFASERHRDLGQIKDIKIIIRQRKTEPYKTKRKQHPRPISPSDQSVKLIQSTANNCKNDELKCALSRLAAHMQLYKDSY